MGYLLAILREFFLKLFLCGLFYYVYYGLFVSCLGVVWVFDFFFLVISICTELLCFGRGFLIECSLMNCFWKIWLALKRADGRSKTPP